MKNNLKHIAIFTAIVLRVIYVVDAQDGHGTLSCPTDCYKQWSQWNCIFSVVRVRNRTVLPRETRPAHCSDRCLEKNVDIGVCSNNRFDNSSSVDDLVSFVSRSAEDAHTHSYEDSTRRPCGDGSGGDCGDNGGVGNRIALNSAEVAECLSSRDCWVEYNFTYSRIWTDCHGRQYVRDSSWSVGKYVGVVLCSSTRYKLFMSDSLEETFLNLADGNGHGQDHCELIGGDQNNAVLPSHFWDSPSSIGYYRYNSDQPMQYGRIGAKPKWTGKYFVKWYECGLSIPGNNRVVKYRFSVGTSPRVTSPTLTVPVTPSFRFEVRPENITAELNMIEVLECRTEPPADIEWYRVNTNSQPLVSGDGIEVDAGGLLLFSSVQRHHAGKYICKAHRGDDVIKSAAYIRFSGNHGVGGNCRHSFVRTPGNVTLERGERRVLPCATSEHSTIAWTKNGVRLTGSSRVRILVNGYLVIRRAAPTDTGYYTCVATSNDGCDIRYTIRLDVVSPDPDECGMPVVNEPAAENLGRRSSEPGRRTLPFADVRQPYSRRPYIVGGSDAKNGSSPWHVMLYYENPDEPLLSGDFCSGVLIGKRHVLTAAHCFTHFHQTAGFQFDIRQLRLKLGKRDSENTEPEEILRHARNYDVHDDFRENLDNDIAIIEMNTPVEYTSYVRPVCLGSSKVWKKVTRDHVTGVSTGWGSLGGSRDTGYLPGPRYLHEILLPIQQQTLCRESTPAPVTDNMFCAGYGAEIVGDTCIGDSGGPFVVKHRQRAQWYLVGLVSWGDDECAREGRFGFFTRVTNYRAWIHRKITNGLN